MSKPIFVTGIGTGVGKTIISAILVEKLKADYWKPIQAGDPDQSDTITVRSLVSNPVSHLHPEAYRLTQPYSPHKAAALDNIEIDPDKIVLPQTDNQLIIEGAGGLMVPLNNNYLMIDLVRKFDAEVILVSRNYLGSINHTLLSIDALKARGITLKALIFNGNNDNFSEELIVRYAPNSLVLRIPEILNLKKADILSAANHIEL